MSPRPQQHRRSARWGVRSLRRGLSLLLILLFAVLIAPGADTHDHEDHQHAHHAPICSLFCLDECTTATLPDVPVPPPTDGLPTTDYAADPVPVTLSRTVEPEHAPPRS